MSDWYMGRLAEDTPAWPEPLPPVAPTEMDAFEAAALRNRRPYRNLPAAGSSNMEAVAEALIPQEPWEYGAMLAFPGLGLAGRVAAQLPKVARMGALAAGIGATPTEAEAGSKRKIAERVVGFAPGGAFEQTTSRVPSSKEVERILSKAPVEAPDLTTAAKYVRDPLRVANPGVYQDPRVIAREANELVEPEHPALKQLFGVTRDDLYGISQQGRRQGNVEPQLWAPTRQGKINEASARVMTEANAQRLVDTLAEAQKYPELTKGMVPWYVMDPMYQQMVKLVGEKRAKEEYVKFNSTVAPFSAGSSVPTEINRGTAANMYRVRGDLPTFKQFGNVAERNRGAGFPDDLRDVKGHMMHGNQIDPVIRYAQTGQHGYANDTVKIPLYMSASGVPQTGFQTRWAVPDTHFASALGMPEVRTGQDFRSYMGGTEYRPIAPWFREQVAEKIGVEAVPAQALTWGTFAPQTGVRTGIGAGKLELLAQNIWERATKLGIDPKKFRDDVLMGKEHALWLLGIPAAGGVAREAMGGVAATDRYEQ